MKPKKPIKMYAILVEGSIYIDSVYPFKWYANNLAEDLTRLKNLKHKVKTVYISLTKPE